MNVECLIGDGERRGAGELSDNEQLVAAYRDHMRMIGRTDATIKRQGLVVRAFARHAALTEAMPATVEEWLGGLDVLPDTRSSYLGALAAFYSWAVRHGHIDHDPTGLIDRPRRRKHLPRPMADKELEHALAEAPNARMRVWLCLAAFEGLRCMEIAGLIVSDLMMGSDPPMVHTVGKGNRERLVPLAEQTEWALAAYEIPRRGALFPNKDGQHYKPDTVSRYIALYLRSTGIDATAHQGRHWFGSEVYRRTKDLRATQELLGHSSVATTQIYVKFSPSTETVSAVRNLTVVHSDKGAARNVSQEGQ